ncbi:response regulator [Salinibius halmophilus]|uniref:response regulator n=1 Tax=Salinibius halmophilus TaxID=1853216 RepID=UPI000E66F960|nr:response regulator [Salinibius halmophilus]
MANVLIVDDSASMRQMVNFTLTTAGHKVVEAVDGVDGLEKAKASQFELIISDINMPNMTGLEMVPQIRALGQYRATPILMLTTESSGDMKQKGKSVGATGWIVKPFNPAQLLNTIKRVL